MIKFKLNDKFFTRLKEVMMDESIARTFDARGLMCPMPIVKAKKEIAEIKVGEILEVLADDEGALEDFSAWCEQTGNELISSEEKDDYYRFLIRRKV